MGYKNESTAILLAFFLGVFGLYGIGHMYATALGRGFVVFFAGAILEVLGWVFLLAALADNGLWILLAGLELCGLLAFWIWQIFDARAVCRRHNKGLMGGH